MNHKPMNNKSANNKPIINKPIINNQPNGKSQALVMPLKLWQMVLILWLSVGLISWLKQQSLSDYWQQTYHNNTPWVKLGSLPFWSTGATPLESIFSNKPLVLTTTVNQSVNEALNQQFYADVLAQKQALLAQKQAEQIQRLKIQQAQKLATATPKVLKSVHIDPTEKVFFVGDSLMQGVAPWVMKELKASYGIESINLSKQSTGLSYDKFLNWPATVEQTFQQNPDIGLMVVFLGPNDPWAVPDPDNKGVYVDFDTPRWHTLYHQKMQKLLDSAKDNNADVIWVTPPNAKKTKLHNNMIALRNIITSGLPNTDVLVINGQLVLGEDELGYSDSLMIEGKLTKVRSGDGIHFTSAGQQHVAQAILQKIHVGS